MTALKQINARIPVELHDALARHKQTTGEDKSDVVRRGIELALAGNMPAKYSSSDSEQPSAVAGPDTAPVLDAVHPEDRETSDSGSSSIDLATWLSGRTGFPKALCRRHVKAGRVTVDGQTYSEPTAPADYLLLPVTLDGNPV